MADADAFLRAICEAPDEDAPRLVFADWLDEHGDSARAEFIRVQCELARLPEDDDRYSALTWRAADLLADHESAWAGPVGRGPVEKRFRRGFVEEVTIDVRAFLDHAENLFRAAPIRHVTFLDPLAAGLMYDCPFLERLGGLKFGRNGSSINLAVRGLTMSPYLTGLALLDLGAYYHGPESARAVAERPYLNRLRTLRIENVEPCESDPIGASGAMALLSSPHLTNLTDFHIDGSMMGNEGLRLLAAAPELGLLRALSVGHAGGSEGVRTLVESPHASELRELQLAHNYMGPEGAYAVAHSRRLANLTALDLRRNCLGLKGLKALAASPYLNCLKSLNVGENVFDEDLTGEVSLTGAKIARILTALPCLSQLTSLHLSACRLGPAGLHVLLDALGENRLAVLDLGLNDLWAEACRCLCASPRLSRLRALGLGGNLLTDEDLALLATAPFMKGVMSLDLSNRLQGGAAGIEALAASPLCRRLTELDLSHGWVGDAGARAMAFSPHLARLTRLGLSGSEIGDDGAAALLASPYLHRPSELSLFNNPLSAESLRALRERFGVWVVRAEH